MAGQEVTFAPRNRSRSPRPNDTTAPERILIKVRSVTGIILANTEMQTQDRCLLLKQKVSAALSICTCKFDLNADVNFMETHHSLHRFHAVLSNFNANNNITYLVIPSLNMIWSLIGEIAVYLVYCYANARACLYTTVSTLLIADNALTNCFSLSFNRLSLADTRVAPTYKPTGCRAIFKIKLSHLKS